MSLYVLLLIFLTTKGTKKVQKSAKKEEIYLSALFLHFFRVFRGYYYYRDIAIRYKAV